MTFSRLPARISARLRLSMSSFHRDERGYVSTEAVIVFPVLMWIFAAAWVYFDAFRQQSINQKANYVIGDMISRETTGITATYLNNTYNLLTLLTRSDASTTNLRTSVVQYVEALDTWVVVWSGLRGDAVAGATTALTNADLLTMADRLPPAMDAEQLVLVETWEDWEPLFNVGLGAFEIKTYSFTSPRYAPQVPFLGDLSGSATGMASDTSDDLANDFAAASGLNP